MVFSSYLTGFKYTAQFSLISSLFCCQGKPGMDFKNRGPAQNFGADRKGALSTEVCDDHHIKRLG